jgi:sulfite exporter TauE/SafE
MKHLDDALILLGAAAVVFGVYQLSRPAAFIVTGVILIVLGFFIYEVSRHGRSG